MKIFSDPIFTFLLGIMVANTMFAVFTYVQGKIYDKESKKRIKESEDKIKELDDRKAALRRVRLKSYCEFAQKLGISVDEYIDRAEKESANLDRLIEEEMKNVKKFL